MHVGRHSQVSLGSFGMAWKSRRKFESPAYSANSNHELVYKLAKILYTQMCDFPLQYDGTL